MSTPQGWWSVNKTTDGEDSAKRADPISSRALTSTPPSVAVLSGLTIDFFMGNINQLYKENKSYFLKKIKQPMKQLEEKGWKEVKKAEREGGKKRKGRRGRKLT